MDLEQGERLLMRHRAGRGTGVAFRWRVEDRIVKGGGVCHGGWGGESEMGS